MGQRIRVLLLFEAATFIVASLIHSGFLIQGYGHPQARIAEGVIAAVLLAGAAWTWVRPRSLRGASLVAQGFALFGTLVGVFTIIVGVGPRTVPDVVYHVSILIVLIGGWRAARRLPRSSGHSDLGVSIS